MHIFETVGIGDELGAVSWGVDMGSRARLRDGSRQLSIPASDEEKESLNGLPDELLLLVFEQLAKLEPEQDSARARVRNSPA